MASTAFCQIAGAVHLRDFGALPIVADTLFMIVLPIAGGHGNVVISKKAADMYIATATTRTGYVARGMLGRGGLLVC